MTARGVPRRWSGALAVLVGIGLVFALSLSLVLTIFVLGRAHPLHATKGWLATLAALFLVSAIPQVVLAFMDYVWTSLALFLIGVSYALFAGNHPSDRPNCAEHQALEGIS